MKNEALLANYVEAHEKGTCNCNGDNLELCLGGNYLAGNIDKEEIFADWE